MTKPHGNTVVCTYRPRPECEADFRTLLADHWPTLRRLDLATDDPPLHLKGDEDGRPVLLEVFSWKDDGAAGAAHEHPEVAAVWERMGALLETRGDLPQWNFVHYERL